MKTIPKFIYAAFAAVTLAIGAVTANGAVNDVFASVNGSGSNGGGFIYHYTSTGVRSIFSSGLSRPRGVAFDNEGNLFVVTSTFGTCGDDTFGQIVKITPGGVQTVFATMSCDSFPEGVAIDRAGNIFVNVLHHNPPSGPPSVTIEKFTPNGVQSTFATPPGAQSFGLAFDSAGNLYTGANFESDPSQIWKYMPDGTPSLFATASSLLYGFSDLAFDRFGILFVSSSDSILKFTPDGAESTFASGLNNPRGLAFNRGGILFVAEIIQTGPGNILRFTPNGIKTVFDSGIGPGGNGGPEFLAVQLPPQH